VFTGVTCSAIVPNMEDQELSENVTKLANKHLCKRGIRAVRTATVPLSTLASITGIPLEVLAAVAGGIADQETCIGIGAILEKYIAPQHPGLLRCTKMEAPQYICKADLWALCDEFSIGAGTLRDILEQSLASCKRILRRDGNPKDLLSITRIEFLSLMAKVKSIYILNNISMIEYNASKIEGYLEATRVKTQIIKNMISKNLE